MCRSRPWQSIGPRGIEKNQCRGDQRRFHIRTVSTAARTPAMKKIVAALTTLFPLLLACLFSLTANGQAAASSANSNWASHRLLYVATPGIRNYLEYGGHGLLVFDMDDGHR